jgi:type II secretory pathway component PulM
MRRRRLVDAWHAVNPAQRSLFVTGGIAVLLAAALAIAWQPFTAALASARDEVARTRVELAIARERTVETESLVRQAAASLRTADVRSTVTRVLGEHSLQSAPVEARSADGRFAVVVADARFDAVVNALDALARNEGIRLVEGTVTARVEPGSVRAELTFAR